MVMSFKEELVEYFTQGYIHVSRQDFLFFNNLVKIAEEKRVTTGQDKLLNKLVDKYKRQLIKEKQDPDLLKRLKWNHELIETRSEYTQARLSWEDDKFTLRCPFSKKFINDLQKMGRFKTFLWDKVKRVYVSPATNMALKEILPRLKNNFGEVVLCPNIQNFLKEVEEVKDLIWKPTIVKSHGNYYILACNEHLYDQIKDVGITLDARNVYQLSKLGIDIASDLLNTEELQFAFNYVNEIDLTRGKEIATWLNNIGISEVKIRDFSLRSPEYANFKDKLTSQGIKVQSTRFHNLTDKIVEDLFFIQFNTWHNNDYTDKNISKVIVVKNQHPVLVL